MRQITSTLCLVCMIVGCAPSGSAERDSEPESAELALRGARVLKHGPLWFGTRVQAEITAAEPVHAFTFEVRAPTQVSLSTFGSATGADVNTVLELYQQVGRSSRLVARNDDHEGSIYAALTRKVQAGRYQVQVTGKRPSARGAFTLEAQCSGRGCPLPTLNDSCIFGERIEDIGRVLRASTVMSVRGENELPDTVAAEQLVLSARHSPEGDVSSVDELFARVDSGLVRWLRVWDDRAGRAFRVFAFRIEGAFYGAAFADGSLELAAEISEGSVQRCSVSIARCRFGETYRDLRDNPAFETLEATVVRPDSAGTLSSTEQEQLVSAVQVAYEDAFDLASALASVDQSEVNQVSLRERASGAAFVAYEYGAGDNSYGGIFATGSAELVARINDGDLLACSLLE